jgi:protein-S-isoprenylcysteine O-methyltransferase Ste14
MLKKVFKTDSCAYMEEIMPDKKKPNLKEMDQTQIVQIVIIRSIITIAVMIGVLFLSAGRWDWWEGWVYCAFTLIILIGSRAVMFANDPDMIVERMAAADEENVKPWDKFFVPVIALITPLITWIIVGLDKRFGWSPDLPNWAQLTALGANFIGTIFSTWATFANRFFSSHVRIQTDRGHIVVKDGPYRFMRHPGYMGGIVSWLSTPVFFSSIWAWIPSLLTVAGYVVRTALEDRTLQEELPGYKEYAQEVRYRLLPGVW